MILYQISDHTSLFQVTKTSYSSPFGRLLMIALLTLTLCSIHGPADAGVNTKNGNFYIAYTDIILPDQMSFDITRTYNSKSTFRGMFGVGWGTDVLTLLNPLPDGSVLVNEHGGGSETLFTAEMKDPGRVAEIVSVLKPFKRWVERNELEEDYIKSLWNNAELRRIEVIFLFNQKLLKPIRLAVGTILKSPKYFDGYIVKTPAGYCRYFENGRKEYFTSDGRLSRTEDGYGNWNSMTYADQGKLKQISTNLGHYIDFSYNGHGLLERLKDNWNRQASYEYNSLGQLIRSIDAGGNDYHYDYDNSSNLTAIRYKNGQTFEIRYYPGWSLVKSVKRRDGLLTSYEYPSMDLSQDPMHPYDSTRVTESKDGKILKNTLYEWIYDRSPTGEKLLRKDVVTTDGDSITYEYDEQGYSVKLTTPAGVTTYLYDDQHSIVYRETPQVIDHFEYHPVNHKLTGLTEMDKSGAIRSKRQYSFNDHWQLLSASDLEGNRVKFEYDGGELSKIVYNSTVISFAKKDKDTLIKVALAGKKLSAEYNYWPEKFVVTSDFSDDERAQLNSQFEDIAAYFKTLREKAQVANAGHSRNCNCSVKHYAIPERLAILEKFKKDID